MIKKVKNPDKSRNNFITKSNSRHNYKYNYDNVEYVTSTSNVEVICPIHGSFMVRPDSHIRKVGCNLCNGGVKFSQEQFIVKAKFIHNDKFNYDKVSYINSNTKIEIVCIRHGSFWMNPSKHLTGQSCPSCNGVKKKTSIDFINDSIKVHGNKYLYENVIYKNNRTKVKIICQKHGIFEQNPKDHLNGHGCNICRESKGQVIIKNLLNILNINFVEEHKFSECVGIGGRKLPFDFYLPNFNICIEFDGKQHFESIEVFGGDIEFNKLKANDLLRNDYCICKSIMLIRIRYNKIQKDLEFLAKVLELKNKYTFPDQKDIKLINGTTYNPIEIDDFKKFIEDNYKGEIVYDYNIFESSCDLYLPNLKLAFKIINLLEYSEIYKSDKNQLHTKNNFENNEIKIVQIFEDNWIYKKDIVKSRILNLLKLSYNKIYSRKCGIKLISSLESNKFLLENHIQGRINSNINIGLFYNDELVSIMTFGKLRKNLGQVSKENSYELLRFCNKLNYNIVGSATKIFSYFLKNYHPNLVISFADKNWSDKKSNLYDKLNFKFLWESSPSYHYIQSDKRKNRFGYRKDLLVKFGYKDLNWTEHKICIYNNLFRIYDSGSYKYCWARN